MMTTLLRVQQATLAARQRTGDDRLAVSVDGGLFQLKIVVDDLTVTPVGPWEPVADVIRRLDEFGQ